MPRTLTRAGEKTVVKLSNRYQTPEEGEEGKGGGEVGREGGRAGESGGRAGGGRDESVYQHDEDEQEEEETHKVYLNMIDLSTEV